MKKKINISPVGLKGNQINERMKQLMGIGSINESKSNIVVELTKVGPDGKAYAIVRENHEWYIKTTDKKTGLVAEDFKYIGGLMNKKSEAYPSYAKAIKHLNLKFKSLAEAHNFEGEINVFENDNLLSEGGMAGFSNEGGSGFSGAGNLENNTPLGTQANAWLVDEIDGLPKVMSFATVEEAKDKQYDEMADSPYNRPLFTSLEELRNYLYENYGINSVKPYMYVKENNMPLFEEETEVDTDVELTTEESAIEAMKDKDDAEEEAEETITEHKLTILKAMENMDAIIDNLTEGKIKKKVYTLK